MLFSQILQFHSFLRNFHAPIITSILIVLHRSKHCITGQHLLRCLNKTELYFYDILIEMISYHVLHDN